VHLKRAPRALSNTREDVAEHRREHENQPSTKLQVQNPSTTKKKKSKEQILAVVVAREPRGLESIRLSGCPSKAAPFSLPHPHWPLHCCPLILPLLFLKVQKQAGQV
jgi:hypothetical protein